MHLPKPGDECLIHGYSSVTVMISKPLMSAEGTIATSLCPAASSLSSFSATSCLYAVVRRCLRTLALRTFFGGSWESKLPTMSTLIEMILHEANTAESVLRGANLKVGVVFRLPPVRREEGEGHERLRFGVGEEEFALAGVVPEQEARTGVSHLPLGGVRRAQTGEALLVLKRRVYLARIHRHRRTTVY